MKCKNCGAETQGKICEYCGSEMLQEESTVNITNNYYCGATPQEQTEIDSNIGKCPKCGNSKVTFKRERIGTAIQSRSRKNYIGTGRQGQSIAIDKGRRYKSLYLRPSLTLCKYQFIVDNLSCTR